MKRIFALILVLALAIGCFAGCGEDKKDSKNEGNKDVASSEKTEVMSFNEISETAYCMNHFVCLSHLSNFLKVKKNHFC